METYEVSFHDKSSDARGEKKPTANGKQVTANEKQVTATKGKDES